MSTYEMVLRIMLLSIGTAILGAGAFIKYRKPGIEVFPVLLLAAGMACIIAATDGAQ